MGDQSVVIQVIIWHLVWGIVFLWQWKEIIILFVHRVREYMENTTGKEKPS